jgi:hypothetical protein
MCCPRTGTARRKSMDDIKTKGIRNLEERMEGADEGSVRHAALKNAKDFKSSWIELGRVLYTVWKDKLYKDWGYQEFEAYVARKRRSSF